MSSSQRARSGVPLDRRSILANVPGVPAWGAVAIAAGLSFLGFVIDAARGTELTGAFAFFYVLGCITAVLLVRHRGLFTAMVQAPLILFVAVPLAYQYFTENAGTGLRDIALNVAIPLVNRFPLMLLGTVVAVVLGAVRIFLKRQNTHAPAPVARRRAQRAPKPGSEQASERPRRSGPAGRDTDPPADARASRSDRARRSGAPSRTQRPPATQRAETMSDSSNAWRADGSRSTAASRRPAAGSRTPQSDFPWSPERGTSTPETPETRRTTPPLRTTPPVRTAPPARGPRAQPPRERADPYTSGARPLVSPRTSEDRQSGDIPPHPVPRVRYRDRSSD